MSKTKIKIGHKYGMLTPVHVVGVNKYGLLLYECVCECGNIKVVGSRYLSDGKTVSCGCKKARSNNMHNTPTYKSWMSAKERCYNPKNHNYPSYGRRGIKMCDKWKDSFVEFLKDMGERPQGMTLDRIDVNGDYEPNNCRWATHLEQSNNRRNNHKVTIGGKTITASEFARTYNINISYTFWGLKNGWTPEEIIIRFNNRKRYKTIMPYPEVVFVEVDELSETERGEGSYGSSGK